MFVAIDLSWNSEYGLYVWTGILIAVILGIAFPLTIYEQKIVKRRWQAVCEFLKKHQGEVDFRPHDQKRDGDILVPVFSGFLIHGHFAYICLDPAQDRQKALSFVRALREFCLAHNSWHFDYFTSRFYAWNYYNKARRALGDP
jgi:hypothetical protein